jgi:predicted Zn-dependent peptidase
MPDRTKQPPFQKTLNFQLREPVAHRLPSGATVFLLNGGDQEVLRLEFVFRAGKWFEPLPGLSHFSSVLLTRGTHRMTSHEIASRLEELGYHIEAGTGADYAYFTAYGLPYNFSEASEIIRQCLTEPSFPERELHQERDIYLQQLKVNREKTSYLASLLFRQQLFGREHPYASEPDPDQLASLTSRQVAEYFTTCYTYFDVFVTGKINSSTEKAVLHLVEQLTWKPHHCPQRPIAPSPQKRVSQYKPEAVQASIRAGTCTITRLHPDFPHLLLATYLLGGFFGSRLMQVIREEKGLTYGIHAHIQSHKHAAVFSISADVNRAQADEAVEECFKQIKELREGKISTKELELAKNHFIGTLQNEMSNTFAHMERFKTRQLFGLPADYYSQLLQRIDSARWQDVASVVGEYLQEEEMVIAIAG